MYLNMKRNKKFMYVLHHNIQQIVEFQLYHNLFELYKKQA